ncbi:glycoside hydrolase family 2 TIM barrel-domain containing protein [Christiangramia sediminis]|uniref:Glycoside hydrolase family 2 n=1 Tax=Christiangramia sediminis TaxID=2881336 RepID=A0A9X1LLV2_9FLAO|nr:glycoside hydrolase family 2 TIM barrel-domain containing protein [Christiangramia sediminis]MCB7482577.1 glycoside hydrolase family 2 [Christiangramia sediminis]
MKISNYLFIVLIFITATTSAQRLVKTVNAGWEFQLENSENTQVVNIPHTWNAQDAFEDDKSYFRGKGIYKRQIFIPENWKDQAVFLKFEGANQHTKVFVNNAVVGEHTGGYTGFIFELSKNLKFGEENVVRIEVDNSHNLDIPPLEADFNFYGGIYRDIEMIVTGKTHFKLEGEAAGTMQVHTPKVSEEMAEVSLYGEIINTSANKNSRLKIEVSGPDGTIIKDFSKNLKRLQDGKFSYEFEIEDPELWSPENPNLYNLQANIIDPDSGEILDSYSTNFGCRWFEADPKKGFFLNGQPIKLIGANRHQDFENMGNAVPNAIHRKDYQMIKDMGANFIRTAHYPQDPDVYRICDELGLLVWTEVPVINDVTDSEAYHENAVNMQREQILQLYNHPSIVFWGIMNEIFIRLVFTSEMSEADKNAKIKTSVALAKKLEAETKKLDTTRLSVMALHENDLYNTSGIADIPDVIGWNLYFGWYTQGLENLGKFLDTQHEKYPNRPLLISEYGPGSDSRIQTNDPKPWDFSEAYQLKSHVSYLNQVMERDYMLGMAAWNFADFGSSGRQDSRPFINQKGLVNFNREPKDVYYYYKARLTPEDFVYIAGKNYEKQYPQDESDVIVITVFSNSEEVKLKVDNAEFTSEVENGIALFELSLPEGKHQLIATDGTASHSREIKVKFRKNLVAEIDQNAILVNVGTHVNFFDEITGETWISDQEYKEGSFGYVGGSVYQKNSSKFQGTASDIQGTENDPLFQTMREGIEAYKFDVEKGKYRVSLLFAEPEYNASQENIYNLSEAEKKDIPGLRNFDIKINGKTLSGDLNLARDYGRLQAVEISYQIKTDAGIEIEFEENSGKALLSGIKLEKL